MIGSFPRKEKSQGNKYPSHPPARRDREGDHPARFAPGHSPHSGVAARQRILISIILRGWPRAFISGTGIVGPGAKAPALSPRAFPIPRKKRTSTGKARSQMAHFNLSGPPTPGLF